MTLEIMMTFQTERKSRTHEKKMIDKLGFFEIKNFCLEKDNIKTMLRQAMDKGKNLHNACLIKDYTKYTKA